MGSMWTQDAGMGELHTGPIHPLSGTDPEFYFVLYVVPPGFKPKGGDEWYLMQYDQAYSGLVGLAILDRKPTWERENQIINHG